MTAPPTAERALCSTRLYRPVRNTYQRVFNRDYVAFRAAGSRFYGQFVDRGDLVFDAGANRGASRSQGSRSSTSAPRWT